FEIPEQVLSDWRGTAERGSAARAEWRNRLEAHGDKAEFERRMVGDLPESFSLDNYIQSLIDEPQKVATRKASEMTLGEINANLPDTIGGSADLTGSNNTKAGGIGPFTADDRSGRYIYYGIREFGMA
ncbi:MAG TPA: transketolase, partial [Erythrobacter sp.]|nr:transketolase [Erythrobacter sp.]